MHQIALLIAMSATSAPGCANGTCAAPAYNYAYSAPATCAGGSCSGYGYGYNSYYYPARTQAQVQPTYAAPAQPTYVAQPTYTAPVQPTYAAPAQPTYAPRRMAAQAPTYYYGGATGYTSSCPNGNCYRR